MAQYGLLLQNCRKRQEKTEKDRKRQKEPERDRKRQKETKTDRKSSIQHMSSHVRSCCNMPANGRSTVVNGIILFKVVARHRSQTDRAAVLESRDLPARKSPRPVLVLIQIMLFNCPSCQKLDF